MAIPRVERHEDTKAVIGCNKLSNERFEKEPQSAHRRERDPSWWTPKDNKSLLNNYSSKTGVTDRPEF